MRIVEALHQKKETPPSVESYLKSVGNSSQKSLLNAQNVLKNNFEIEGRRTAAQARRAETIHSSV